MDGGHRGGRAPVGGPGVPRVPAPTLLIVSGNDGPVIDLNREAMARMGAGDCARGSSRVPRTCSRSRAPWTRSPAWPASGSIAISRRPEGQVSLLKSRRDSVRMGGLASPLNVRSRLKSRSDESSIPVEGIGSG